MKVNKYVLIFLLFVIIGFFSKFIISNNKISFEGVGKLLERCGKPSNEVSYRDCVSDTIVTASDSIGTEDSLNSFEEYLEKNPELMVVCHDIAHKIGYQFYLKDKVKNILKNKKYCAYGYYHGIFQGYMELNNKVVNFAYDLCKDIDGNAVLVECVHGIGHAAYHVKEDPYSGLKECELIPDKGFIGACANGVVMAYQSNISNEKIKFNYKDCFQYSRDVVLGCITNTVYNVVKDGELLNNVCPEGDFNIFKNCSYGYAKGLSDSDCVSTYCLGTKELDIDKLDKFKALFDSCNNVKSCANAYGFFSYQSYKDKAVSLCERYFNDESLSLCLKGFNKAKSCVSNFPIVLHHYRPCRLEGDV